MAQAEDIKKVRRQIGDAVKAEADIQTASGNDRQFALRYNNLFDELVQVDGVERTSGFEFDGDAGLITFDSNLDEGAVLKVAYKYAAFTDQEIGDMIDATSVAQATVDLIKELLANAARLYNYTQGPTKADKQQVFKNLKDLLDIYKAEAADFNGQGGVAIGKRTNEAYRPSPVRGIKPDLSRDDEVRYER